MRGCRTDLAASTKADLETLNTDLQAALDAAEVKAAADAAAVEESCKQAPHPSHPIPPHHPSAFRATLLLICLLIGADRSPVVHVACIYIYVGKADIAKLKSDLEEQKEAAKKTASEEVEVAASWIFLTNPVHPTNRRESVAVEV